MVRPRMVAKNFVPVPWISESESDEDLASYEALKQSQGTVPMSWKRKRKIKPTPAPSLSIKDRVVEQNNDCLLYTSPSPRD